MNNALNKTAEYRDWLKDLKKRVRQAQLKAAVQVNSALLIFYWELGADIVERQKSAKWFFKATQFRFNGRIPGYEGVLFE